MASPRQERRSDSVFGGGEGVKTKKDLLCENCCGSGKDLYKFSYRFNFDSSDSFFTACDECGGSGHQDLEINKEEE